MSKNGKDTKHTSHISRRVHFLRYGENWKMHNIYWCEGGLQLADIATKYVGENNLNARIKYIMVRLDNIMIVCWSIYLLIFFKRTHFYQLVWTKTYL